MKIQIVKKRKPADIEDMLKVWEKKYGSLTSLHQKVLISKCTSPGMMDDYVMWKNLADGAEFHDIIILRDSEIFDALSPRRVELLEYLMNNNPKSIRTLATALHRDYKNVYDDLNALSKYELIDLIPQGRALKPAAAAARIEITFES
ncbi:MAG: hypothetical protein Q7J68_00765 [Thermoplasmata archaeon]|nr:hypothetical protein [Thermoplasmata archaeon]